MQALHYGNTRVGTMHAIKEICYLCHSPKLGPAKAMLIEGFDCKVKVMSCLSLSSRLCIYAQSLVIRRAITHVLFTAIPTIGGGYGPRYC